MRKMVHMFQWKVGDKVFVIHTMKRLEYNGEWVNDGFDVYYKDNKTNFVGYPIDKDLLDFAESVDKK